MNFWTCFFFSAEVLLRLSLCIVWLWSWQDPLLRSGTLLAVLEDGPRSIETHLQCAHTCVSVFVDSFCSAWFPFLSFPLSLSRQSVMSYYQGSECNLSPQLGWNLSYCCSLVILLPRLIYSLAEIRILSFISILVRQCQEQKLRSPGTFGQRLQEKDERISYSNQSCMENRKRVRPLENHHYMSACTRESVLSWIRDRMHSLSKNYNILHPVDVRTSANDETTLVCTKRNHRIWRS